MFDGMIISFIEGVQTSSISGNLILLNENVTCCFVLGHGFDPRAGVAVNCLISAKSDICFDTLALKFDHGSDMPNEQMEEAAKKNWSEIYENVESRGEVNITDVIFRGDGGRNVGARNSANVFSSRNEITKYTDIVIDISAMPQSSYYPLIARLLFFYDELRKEGKNQPNIHVVVSEDPDLDSEIRAEGVDETASFLHPFEGAFNREATGQLPKIWFPVLGEGQEVQIDRIYNLINPDEICPVLPSPSRNPKQGDKIVMEYHELLFDQLRIDPRNIIYCSEFNPFEVYRQIRKSAIQYDSVFQLVGGCKIAISALCNKLMSLGILLVAYELKQSGILNLGIAQIDCKEYIMSKNASLNAEPVGLWLVGECYD